MSMLLPIPEGPVFALSGAFAVGLALGLLYDLLRPFRLHAPLLGEFLLDLLYWFIVTVAVFACAPLLGDGHVRIVMLLVHAFGAFCYFKLLSRPVRWLTSALERFFGKLISLILWPFRRFLALLSEPLLLFLSHFKKIIKKIFSFPPKWFTINKIPKKTTPHAGQSSENGGGQQHVQNQKGWSSD